MGPELRCRGKGNQLAGSRAQGGLKVLLAKR